MPHHKVIEEDKYIDPYGKLTEKEIVKGKNACTTFIACCSGGGITMGDEVVLFHLKPEDKNIKNFKKIKDALKEKSGITKNDGMKAGGFIIGGVSEKSRKKDPRHNHLLNCIKLVNIINNFFKENKIPTTIIWGRNKGKIVSDIYYSGKEHTWFILVNGYKIKNAKKLKKAFEITKFSKKDKEDGIWINGKKLTDEGIAELEAPRLSPFQQIGRLCSGLLRCKTSQ